MPPRKRLPLKAVLITATALLLVLGGIGCSMMHKGTFSGKGTVDTNTLPLLTNQLSQTINTLAGQNWRRHAYDPEGLNLANTFITRQLQASGYTVTTQAVTAEGDRYALPLFYQNKTNSPFTAYNLIAEKTGEQPDAGIIILGAHYDTMIFSTDWVGLEHDQFRPDVPGTPGADDNASGVAALLAIAEALKDVTLKRTIRFCAFANEEPPFFQQKDGGMGSWVYAAAQKSRAKTNTNEHVHVMISLETMAVYTASETNNKRGFLKNIGANLMGLPAKADYVAFMSNWKGLSTSSGREAKRWAGVFAINTDVDVRTVSLPYIKGEVFAWSDDWSFTRHGFKAFTVTDTAAYRSDRYHEGYDRPDQITEHDYTTFAKVVQGLVRTIIHMANE